jgi:uncharacterized protein (TIGR02611 family)
VLRRIAEQRQRVILTQAARYLDPGEEVVQWVRAKQVDGRAEGFVFLTPRRCIVHWTGRGETSPGDFPWETISAWGVQSDAHGGPILALRDGDESCFVQLRATTPAMAERVAGFVREFAERAPWPRATIDAPQHLDGPFEATAAPEVPEHRRSITEHTRRILVTVLGVALIVSAIVIIPLPGPWSFVVTIAGLAILASEYDWARDALAWSKDRYKAVSNKIKARRQSA